MCPILPPPPPKKKVALPLNSPAVRFLLALCALLLALFVLWSKRTFVSLNQLSSPPPTPTRLASPSPSPSPTPSLHPSPPATPLTPEAYVGPRENIPAAAPQGWGFWSFAQPVPGVLSRSGQPLLSHFQWLKEKGWKGVVNLRVDGERDEVGDDLKIPGFKELNFRYLHLPITDGLPPSEEQAEEFLRFVTNPANLPVHIHCRGGIGRAGTMVALYRYAVQGWPMDDAIAESRAFKGGVSELQEKWLRTWAEKHPPAHFRR